MRGTPGSTRRSTLGPSGGAARVLVILAATALVAVGACSGPDEQPAAPAPPAADAGTRAPSAQASPSAPPAPGAREPAGWVRGHTVWLAPEPRAEAALPGVSGPIPQVIEVDALYPALRPGNVRSAVMLLGVVEDTSVLRRLLVLDELWQLYEVDLDIVAGRGGPVLSQGSLSPDGRRVAFGRTGAVVVLDLTDLRTRRIAVGNTSTRGLGWSGRDVVLPDGRVAAAGPRPVELASRGGTGFGTATGPVRTESTTGGTAALVGSAAVGEVRTQDPRPAAVVVDGDEPAVLLLDGPRSPQCCAVAGWADPERVLYESRHGRLLHLLVWDTTTGSVGLVTRIEPVVSNDWYVLTSYRRLDIAP